MADENRPLIKMELVILDQYPFKIPDEDLNMLLSYPYRNDQYFSDHWHSPGGYLGNGEKVF